MKILKKILKDYYGDDETNKKISSEIESTSAAQNVYIEAMRCPICGNNEFNESLITACDGKSNASVEGVISYYGDYNKNYKVKTKMCLHCGFIITFADMNSLKIDELTKINSYLKK